MSLKSQRLSRLPGLAASLTFAPALLWADAGGLERVFPAEEWTVAAPHALGLDPETFEAAIGRLDAICGELGNRRSVVVYRGYVVWRGAGAGSVEPVWSCTKSVLSVCMGLLWDDGKLAPDDYAWRFDPALKSDYPGVTLAHLATFTSGVNYHHKTHAVGAPRHAPGEIFRYSAESDLLARLLTIAAGERLEALFARRIGIPLGIRSEEWT